MMGKFMLCFSGQSDGFKTPTFLVTFFPNSEVSSLWPCLVSSSVSKALQVLLHNTMKSVWKLPSCKHHQLHHQSSARGKTKHFGAWGNFKNLPLKKRLGSLSTPCKYILYDPPFLVYNSPSSQLSPGRRGVMFVFGPSWSLASLLPNHRVERLKADRNFAV